jgi:hypothetical protein
LFRPTGLSRMTSRSGVSTCTSCNHLYIYQTKKYKIYKAYIQKLLKHIHLNK